MLNFIRKITPKFIFNWYHLSLAWLAAVVYGHPSEELVVIGVTGTNGKTTTVNLIYAILEAAGHVVGLTSTVNFKISGQEKLNDLKMTMPGRFMLQKFLRDLRNVGGKFAIIETSSQGVAQHRHRGINYDVAVFTKLTPEHIEAHGGFENYKAAKGEFFCWTASGQRKSLGGVVMPKVSVVNSDDKYAAYFLKFKTDLKIKYGLIGESDITPTDLQITGTGSSWKIDGVNFETKLIGDFNVENCLAAISVGTALKIPLEIMSRALRNFASVPGRLEFIDAGQNFKVLVDYAPEPASFAKLYEIISKIDKNKTIHVLGSAGGGRDVARRPVLGGIAGAQADVVIVTNEDPYDEDPWQIIKQVAAGAIESGKVENENLFLILDRGAAISKALSLAGSNDLVVITGKGAEQAIVSKNGKMIPWDDRQVTRDLIAKL